VASEGVLPAVAAPEGPGPPNLNKSRSLGIQVLSLVLPELTCGKSASPRQFDSLRPLALARPAA